MPEDIYANRNRALADAAQIRGGNTGGVSIPGSVGANVAAVPQIDQLTQLINEIQQTTNNARIPGAAGLQQQSSGNIASALGGQLDPSVINQIGQAAAERGVMSGSPTGANSNADYLRAIGRTSMDLMNTGENWLTGALARNPSAQFDPASMFITPAQQAQLNMEQQRIDLARQQQGSGRRGAPGGTITMPGGGGRIGNSSGGFAPQRGGGAPPINWEDLFRGGNTTSATGQDSFSDFDTMNWTGYSPFGSGGGQDDFSDFDTMDWANYSPFGTSGSDNQTSDWADQFWDVG